MDAKLMLIQTLSPLHAGTGQGVGVIDLPIAREKATQIPFLPGSTLKGVFRDACTDENMRTNVFGPDTGNAELHAGAVTFTDARLLLLPVRSLSGVFAWVTSPLLLRRFARDVHDVEGLSVPAQIPPRDKEEECLVSNQDSGITMSVGDAQKVILEDLPLDFAPSADVTEWANELGKMLFPQDEEWRQELNKRLCVVHDNVLSFLLETATEISARIRIEDDKKAVERGALWYEEALPAETVLASLVVAAPVKATREQVFETVTPLTEKTLQFGGNATIGRGLCKATLV